MKLFVPVILITGLFLSLFISCEKDDETTYSIETILYKIETSVDDPGLECELYGNIWSYPEANGHTAIHDHLQHSEDSYLEMGLNDSRILNETAVTVKTWQDVKESGKMMVRIKLFEDDVDLIDTDDSFGDDIFEIPVSDIINGQDETEGYYEAPPMQVLSGTESITVTFRFRVD